MMKIHFIVFTIFSPEVSVRFQRLQSAGETLLALFASHCRTSYAKQRESSQRNLEWKFTLNNCWMYLFSPHGYHQSHILVCSGCYNKIDQVAKTTDIGFSWFWGWKVQDPDASQFGSWWGPTSWLADGCLLVVSSRGREKELFSLSLLIRMLIPSRKPQPHDLI